MWFQPGPAACSEWNSRRGRRVRLNQGCLNNDVEKCTASLCEHFSRRPLQAELFRGRGPMPTLSKARLTECESPWLETWDRMHQYLSPNKVPILTALGFYAEHDLPNPEADSAGSLTVDEKAELGAIATALTIAAVASDAMPTAVLIATLHKVSSCPLLFFSGQLPAAVEWEIAGNYQRGCEKPATHWRDVWGNQLEGDVEVPTQPNITRAALSAIDSIQGERRRGRPYNVANQILADRLGEIFRQTGQLIVRVRQPAMRGDELVFIEAGPFYDFLELVVPPLQRYLRERELAPVTVDTVVRFVTEAFPSVR